MKKRFNKNKQLFMSFPVIADLLNKKLLITKETFKHLNELTYFSLKWKSEVTNTAIITRTTL